MDWSVCEEKLRAPLITRTDEQFLAKNLEFVWGLDGLDLIELNDLFEKVMRLSCLYDSSCYCQVHTTSLQTESLVVIVLCSYRWGSHQEIFISYSLPWTTLMQCCGFGVPNSLAGQSLDSF